MPRRTVLLAALAAVATTSCVSSTASAPAPSAEAAAPKRPGTPPAITVLPGRDAAELALATSRALHRRARLVVLADERDIDAQARAASAAVRLGAPLLLVPASAPAPRATRSSPDTDAVAEELSRLQAETLLAVGSEALSWAKRLEDAPHIVPAPSDPGTLSRMTGAAGPRRIAAAQLTREVAARRRAAPLPLLIVRPPTRPSAAAAPRAPEPQRLQADAPPAPAGLPLVLVSAASPTSAAAAATARAAGADVLVATDADPRADPRVIRALSRRAPGRILAVGSAFGSPALLEQRVAVSATGVELPGGGQRLFPGRRIVTLYGHPGARSLGVLGEQPVAAAIQRARKVAAPYQRLTREPVIAGFDLIATVASNAAGPDGNYSAEASVAQLRPWVEAAERAGLYVVLDLQPGRTDFLTQARRYEALLARPNVGLALDPEWRLAPGQRHLRQIGSVRVEEVNSVVTWLADLVRARRLPQKLLFVHQFRLSMIKGRERLDTRRDELAMLIQMDGNGPRRIKLNSWRAITATPPPRTWFGWKNFYDEDTPTWTPQQTLRLSPSPRFVSYQ